MKIVCDACSATYSIADEKVQGKVFKIRCKKCSNIIVVRGTGEGEAAAPAAAAAPAGSFDQKETRVYDYGGYEGGAPASADEGVWHIVVDQEQVGPLTVAEVQARFAAGEIDSESYIWREGFSDWLPLAQVPEFTSLVASGSTTTAQPSSGADAVASMFGASNYEEPAAAAAKSDPGDVFAAHAAKQDDAGGDDLFGTKGAAKPRSARKTGAPAPDADAPLFGSEAKPAQAANVSSMKGQRNENSVLFSLGNLAALASDQPRAQAAPSSSSSSASSAGAASHGGGEGSGLIDIRSMANAYLGGAKPGAPAGGGPKVGSADDLPVFSTASFAEPAVIIPTMGGSRNNNKMLYILLGAVALLAIVAVVLVVVVLGKSDSKAPAVAANDKGSDKGSADKGSAIEKGSDAPDPAAGTATDPGAKPADPGTKPADPGAGSSDPDVGPSDPGTKPADPGTKPGSGSAKPSGGSSKPSGGSAKPSGGSSKPSGGSSKPVEPPPTSGGKCSMGEVECMLAPKPPACCSVYGGGRKTGGGGGGGGTSGGGGGGGGGDLADSLTKSDISAGVGKISAKASACGAKSSAKGKVTVSVKVSGGGTVTSVTVKESPDPALGSCVAAAMQKATFAKTKNGGSFSYPFRF